MDERDLFRMRQLGYKSPKSTQEIQEFEDLFKKWLDDQRQIQTQHMESKRY